MDVTVVVGTFGSAKWIDLARERAIPSATAEGVPVIHRHASTLHDARNQALWVVPTPWVCFLDADDELEPGYFEAMDSGTADVRAPRVRYVQPRRTPKPIMPRVSGHTHDCTADCLDHGNWLVIGALAPTGLVKGVGGFRDFEVYEDYDLWVRCRAAGATFESVPEAIYRAHVRPDSRNRGPDRATKHAAHQAIARANGLPVPA